MSSSHSPRKSVSIVTTSRADFGIYRSVLELLEREESIALDLIVTGMHLSPEFGNTITDVKAAGIPIRDSFNGLVSSDSEEGIATSMGLTTIGAAQSFAKTPPDLLMVLGDRFEMHAVALAALPFRIPVAHIHGGEETEGAIDNSLRHSITKLSHLHFCATQLAAKRVRAMGEASNRVIVSGAPALDNLRDIKLLDRHALETRFGIPAKDDFYLVTFHPETLDPEASLRTLEDIAGVLLQFDPRAVFTLANADTLGRAMNDRIRALVASSPDKFLLVEHMGVQGYFSAMNAASAMIGNSSSGIIEAASFGLPVVNIGDRQRGREQSRNTINASPKKEDIKNCILQATSNAHREICAQNINVYGDGNAAQKICASIVEFLGSEFDIKKSFQLGEDH